MKGRILLAHGNTDCQTIYGSALAHDGYLVDIAADIDAALTRLGQAPYDLVVADLYLPTSVEGDECLIRRMRHLHHTAHLPVVVLTGWTTEQHRRVARQEDADDFLTLPTRPRDLITAVASLLDQPSGPAQSPAADGSIVKEF